MIKWLVYLIISDDPFSEILAYFKRTPAHTKTCFWLSNGVLLFGGIHLRCTSLFCETIILRRLAQILTSLPLTLPLEHAKLLKIFY